MGLSKSQNKLVSFTVYSVISTMAVLSPLMPKLANRYGPIAPIASLAGCVALVSKTAIEYKKQQSRYEKFVYEFPNLLDNQLSLWSIMAILDNNDIEELTELHRLTNNRPLNQKDFKL